MVREELRDCARILDRAGLVAEFGHVSARSGDGGAYLLSPRRAPRDLEVEDLLEVPLGESIEPSDVPQPLEAAIHTSVYRARTDVGAVMRIHSRAANVLSVIDTPVRPHHFLGTSLGGPVPVCQETGLITDEATARRMVVDLGDATAVLLRGNGQVIVGRTIREATVRALYLNETAQMQLDALQSGRPVHYDPDFEECARVWSDVVNIDRVWDYRCRGLNRPRLG